MKSFHWILLLILITGSAMLITEPEDTAARVDERIDLNWKFMRGDHPDYSAVRYDDSDWEFVALPHDWITREVSRDHPSGTAGGYYPGGVAWYRKDLYIGAYDKKEKFYLVFDGIYMNTDIWVNGNNLGEHKYGYIGFHFDITPFVRKDTVNVLAVRTDCSNMPADRWYSGAGIYRNVRLVATENLHFPVHNTRITTEVRDGNRYVIAETDVVNSENRTFRYEIRSDLVSPDGKLVSSTITPETAMGKSRLTVRTEHLVSDPQLWSDKDPVQYELNTYLVHKNTISDHVATKFGIRDIAFSPDSILFVMDSLVTAGPPHMILMEPDRTEMIANGMDVVHIETRVTDEAGITSPSASNNISYQLIGPGKIKVIDNGDPNDQPPRNATAKNVRNGRHLLIIQSAMEPGDLIIRAKSAGLKSAEVTVKSVAPEQE